MLSEGHGVVGASLVGVAHHVECRPAGQWLKGNGILLV